MLNYHLGGWRAAAVSRLYYGISIDLFRQHRTFHCWEIIWNKMRISWFENNSMINISVGKKTRHGHMDSQMDQVNLFECPRSLVERILVENFSGGILLLSTTRQFVPWQLSGNNGIKPQKSHQRPKSRVWPKYTEQEKMWIICYTGSLLHTNESAYLSE